MKPAPQAGKSRLRKQWIQLLGFIRKVSDEIDVDGSLQEVKNRCKCLKCRGVTGTSCYMKLKDEWMEGDAQSK